MSLQNLRAIAAIYKFELHRFRRTLLTGLLVPVITTSLYFVVFGGAIGSRMTEVDGIPYAAFIVPGLIMMSVIQNSYGNVVSSFFSTKFQHSIEEMMVSPMPAQSREPMPIDDLTVPVRRAPGAAPAEARVRPAVLAAMSE